VTPGCQARRIAVSAAFKTFAICGIIVRISKLLFGNIP